MYGDQNMIFGGFEFLFFVEVFVGVVMIFVILIFLEIIFKIFGANNWKQFLGFIVNFFNIVIFVFYLFVWLSQLIMKFMKKDKDKSVFSWVDFFVMAEIGEKEGIF